MNTSAKKHTRVLAIDPSRRGFGFAVLEGPERLIDWGVKEARREESAERLRRIAIVIERYRPDVIVIENYQTSDSRCCPRIRTLLEGIVALASSKRVRLKKVARSSVKRRFSKYKASNKHQIAVEIGKQFPELAALVPPPRKPWMAQVARMSIFDAVGSALAFYRW